MSRVRTFVLALLLLPVPAAATEVDGLIETFASCTGRYSAELEHAWLMNDNRADEIAHRRQQFIDILGAIVPAERQRDMLHIRIQTKLAHAGLLTQVAFDQDREKSRWALRRAVSEMNYCAGFLLDS